MTDFLAEARSLHDRIVGEIEQTKAAKDADERERKRLNEARDKVLEIIEQLDDPDPRIANVYTVHFVRYVEDAFEKLSPEGAVKQLAGEIQEAFDAGHMAGFFNVAGVERMTYAEADKVLGTKREDATE